MSANSFKWIFACLVLAMFGCKAEITLRDTQLWNGKPIHAEVVRLKASQENGKSLLYGSLVFENAGQTGVKANLSCVAVSLEGISSERIYIDSVASVSPDGYLIDKGRTRVAVYWKIDKRFDSTLEGMKFKLLVSSECKLIQ